GLKEAIVMGSEMVSMDLVVMSPLGVFSTTKPFTVSWGTSIVMVVEVFDLKLLTFTFDGSTTAVTLSKFLPMNFNSPPLKAGDGPKLNSSIPLGSSSSSSLLQDKTSSIKPMLIRISVNGKC